MVLHHFRVAVHATSLDRLILNNCLVLLLRILNLGSRRVCRQLFRIDLIRPLPGRISLALFVTRDRIDQFMEFSKRAL